MLILDYCNFHLNRLEDHINDLYAERLAELREHGRTETIGDRIKRKMESDELPH
jgi:hypothetical protein